MKQKPVWVCFTTLICLLALLLLPRESHCTRRGGDDFFSLEMGPLNSTMAESFSMDQGDAVDARVSLTSGELFISIGQNGQKPIYEGRNPELGSFRVNIPEAGNYLLTISGKRAKGSVSFQIIRGEQSIG